MRPTSFVLAVIAASALPAFASLSPINIARDVYQLEARKSRGSGIGKILDNVDTATSIADHATGIITAAIDTANSANAAQQQQQRGLEACKSKPSRISQILDHVDTATNIADSVTGIVTSAVDTANNANAAQQQIQQTQQRRYLEACRRKSGFDIGKILDNVDTAASVADKATSIVTNAVDTANNAKVAAAQQAAAQQPATSAQRRYALEARRARKSTLNQILDHTDTLSSIGGNLASIVGQSVSTAANANAAQQQRRDQLDLVVRSFYDAWMESKRDGAFKRAYENTCLTGERHTPLQAFACKRMSQFGDAGQASNIPMAPLFIMLVVSLASLFI